MSYKIVYTEKVVKYLESLDKKHAYRIYRKIEGVRDNPLHYIEKLVSINLWKLRIGNYRAIIRFNKLENEISVIDLGHRKNVYKNL